MQAYYKFMQVHIAMQVHASIIMLNSVIRIQKMKRSSQSSIQSFFSKRQASDEAKMMVCHKTKLSCTK